MNSTPYHNQNIDEPRRLPFSSLGLITIGLTAICIVASSIRATHYPVNTQSQYTWLEICYMIGTLSVLVVILHRAIKTSQPQQIKNQTDHITSFKHGEEKKQIKILNAIATLQERNKHIQTALPKERFTNINAIIDNILEKTQSQWLNIVDIETSLDLNIKSLASNANMIDLALKQLIKNSIHNLKQNRTCDTAVLSIATRMEKSNIIISIRDNGQMNDHDIEKEKRIMKQNYHGHISVQHDGKGFNVYKITLATEVKSTSQVSTKETITV